MNPGIVLCSRTNSERVPNKPLRKINGVPLIEHLVRRLIKTEIQVYVAVPKEQVLSYLFLELKYPGKVTITCGYPDDPLARMYQVAQEYKLDPVVRVTHDKLFVDPELVVSGVKKLVEEKADYLSGVGLSDGTRFEVISHSALRSAASKFKKVEFISYAVRAVAKKTCEIPIPSEARSGMRLLVDYPEDLTAMETLLSVLGNDATIAEVNGLLKSNPWVSGINDLPLITIYTCAFNAEKFIDQCMGSVEDQKSFQYMEYIIVDDFSTDGTPYKSSAFAFGHRNVKWIRNSKNLGLASSSNIALKLARGKYVVRLDADDYFTDKLSLINMLIEMEKQEVDILYPDHYFGDLKTITSGKANCHAGGALFTTRALNHVKFTDGLRGHDSLDLFVRAKEQLKIGYYNKPTFFYRQRPDSMSKTNLAEREKIKADILRTSA